MGQARLIIVALMLACLFGARSPYVLAAAAKTLDVHFDLVVMSDEQALAPLLKSASRLIEKKDEPVVSLARLEGRLQGDITSFYRVLRSEGYYDAIIDSRVIRDGQRLKVSVVVNPGIRFRIKASGIELTGGNPADTPDLTDLLIRRLPEGAPARSELIVRVEQRLVAYLGNHGYPFAIEGERRVVIDHADASATVTYVIDTGPKASFGEVRFKGMETAEPGYLARFVPWQEGAPYSQIQTEELRQRLASSGLFRTVMVSPVRQEGALDTAVPLDVVLEDGPQHMVELGAGYSTGRGFEAETAWTARNLWGRGENLKLAATFGETEQAFRANLRKPHFRRYDQTLTSLVRVGRENTPAYKSYLLETAAGIERRLNKQLVGGVGLESSVTQVIEDDSKDEFVLLGTPIALTWDTTENLLDPKGGLRANVRVRPSVSLIRDQFLYLTTELNMSAYHSFLYRDRLTLAVRGRVASIMGASLNQLPASERLFSGGGGSVRGFDYQGIGPKQDDGDPLGGLSVAEVSFEARVKLSDTLGLVPFLDGGNVYDNRVPGFGGFRWGAGIGVRYYTAVAPIRVDVAFPLDRRTGENSVALYVSLGQSF